MKRRFGAFLVAMLMLFWPGAALPTVAHEDAPAESVDGLGLAGGGAKGVAVVVAWGMCGGACWGTGEMSEPETPVVL